MSKGKITIIKRLVDQELIDHYRHETTAPYSRFTDGQVFEVEDWGLTPPEGFCEWAWVDLRAKIEFAEKVDAPVAACCTDAFRTVVFEIWRNR